MNTSQDRLMNSQDNTFTYNIAVNNKEEMKISLKKEDADFSYNQLVLNSLVGTLVKYGMSGKIEPYLASTWSVSNNNKTWKFDIRNKLYAEDGKELTASLYVKTLTENLKKYSDSGTPIIFDQLLGWKNFVSGISQTILGIKSLNNTIVFDFESNPGDLLEFLRMPYFGFWLENENKINSTGPYVLENDHRNEINLKLRREWFTSDSSSYQNVIIKFTSLEEKLTELKKNEMIRLPFFIESNNKLENGYWIASPPTRLESFILSPTKNNFFDNLNNRKKFALRIRENQPSKIKSNHFYLSARTEIKENAENIEYLNTKKTQEITVGLQRTNYSVEEIEKFKFLLEYALDGTNIKFNFFHKDLKDKSWLEKTLSNDYYDIRISSVDIGGYPDFSILKMMFCTKMGVTFPDPSGRVCNLAINALKSGIVMNQSHVDEFNHAIRDDAVVIPIQHHSDKWFVTNDIDPKSLPPTTFYPQFELIRKR